MAVDITARVAMEANPRHSQERFQLVSRATSDAVWDWDLKTNQLWWGDGFRTLFGYDRSGISPEVSWWAARIHPEDRERANGSTHKAHQSPNQSTWTEEYRYLLNDGAYAVVQDRGHILRDAEGKAVRMFGGMTAITEHKKLMNQYLRAQRMESIGTLAGGNAHDLNNVLAPILMSVDLLRFSITDEPTLRLINTVEQSSKREADLVRRVLTYARGVNRGQHVAIKVEHLIKDVARIASETFPSSIRSFQIKLWPFWLTTTSNKVTQ